MTMNSEEEPNDLTLKEWHDDPKNWRSGKFYYNKKDKRFFLPRRSKGGWTINFANPNTILFLCVILLLIFIGCLKKIVGRREV